MAAVKRDAVLASAVDVARAALVEIAEPGTIGEHLGMEMLAERLGMHWFDCTSSAYVGWRWGVSVARVPRGKVATVCETNLLPGPAAVLAPEWLPYAERLAPGDLGAGDVLPYKADDPFLVQGFEATGEEDVDQVAIWELGLGRPRVLSAEGREAAAIRWYDGEHGPNAAMAQKASARCSTCGYYVPMAGALRAVFGVCANEWSPSDGGVVSLDHGCGAHSETHVEQPEPPTAEPIVDELAVDIEPALRAQRDDLVQVEPPGPAEQAAADAARPHVAEADPEDGADAGPEQGAAQPSTE